MKPFKQLSFIGLAIMLVLTSCSMKRRVYMYGYHVQWNKSKLNSDRQKFVNNDNGKHAEQNQLVTVVQSENETNTVDNSFFPIITTSFLQDNFATTDSSEECDEITLKNGDDIKAKVTEITTEEIKYKKCDNLNGPTYSIKKSEVFMITYSNSTKNIISPFNTSSNNSTSSGKKIMDYRKSEVLGLIGFMCSLAGFFMAGIILGALAVIFGAMSLGKISDHPEKFKGKGFGIVSIILGLIDILGVLIILSLLV